MHLVRGASGDVLARGPGFLPDLSPRAPPSPPVSPLPNPFQEKQEQFSLGDVKTAAQKKGGNSTPRWAKGGPPEGLETPPGRPLCSPAPPPASRPRPQRGDLLSLSQDLIAWQIEGVFRRVKRGRGGRAGAEIWGKAGSPGRMSPEAPLTRCIPGPPPRGRPHSSPLLICQRFTLLAQIFFQRRHAREGAGRTTCRWRARPCGGARAGGPGRRACGPARPPARRAGPFPAPPPRRWTRP